MIQLTFFIRIENELLTEQVKLRFINYHVCDFFIKILSFYQWVFRINHNRLTVGFQ